jgi:hypothetical protein
MSKKYIFTYMIAGEGDTEEEALEDALEAFLQDIGPPIETELEEDTESSKKTWHFIETDFGTTLDLQAEADQD